MFGSRRPRRFSPVILGVKLVPFRFNDSLGLDANGREVNMLQSRNSRFRFARRVVCFFIVLLGLSLVGCDESASRLLCIGKAEELFIGNQLAPGIVRLFGGEANDSETQLLITRIGKSITDKCDRQGMPWEFHYLNSKIPNAASLPGHIFITTALVDHLKNRDGQVDEDMLAGALSHEIAHVVARHVARAVAEQRFADLAEAGLDLITKRDVTADQNEQFDRKVLLFGYSREHELEADRFGAIYAARAGYSKDGLVRVAKVLIGLESNQLNRTPWYFRTHPYPQERLAALQRELPMLNDQNVSAVAFQVKDECKGWWGLANLGVQYVRAKFILKSGAQIQLADSTGTGYPDTVIRVAGQQRTYYKTAVPGKQGLWQVATTVGPNGKPTYTGLVGYSPLTAHAIKQQADALLAQGHAQTAIKEYKRAIGLGASDAGTQTQLAKAYEKVGDKVGAQAAYRSVLREEWQGPQTTQAETALKQRGTTTVSSPSALSTNPAPTVKQDRAPNSAERALEELNRQIAAAGGKTERPDQTQSQSNVAGDWEVDLEEMQQSVIVTMFGQSGKVPPSPSDRSRIRTQMSIKQMGTNEFVWHWPYSGQFPLPDCTLTMISPATYAPKSCEEYPKMKLSASGTMEFNDGELRGHFVLKEHDQQQTEVYTDSVIEYSFSGHRAR
jgi:predicted Zn-dependent protease